MLYFFSGANGGTPGKLLAELPGEGRSACLVKVRWCAASLPVAGLLIERVGDVDLGFAVDAGVLGLACGFCFLHGDTAPTELSGAP